MITRDFPVHHHWRHYRLPPSDGIHADVARRALQNGDKDCCGLELMGVTAQLVFFRAVALPNNKQLYIYNKVLIIRPNITYRYSTTLFCCTLQHVSAVQISLHQLDVGYTKRNMKGERESRCLMNKEKYERRERERERERESRCLMHKVKYERR